MRRIYDILQISCAIVMLSCMCGAAGASSDAEDIARRMRIAECANTPPVQLMLLGLNEPFSREAGAPPAWQTLPSDTASAREELSRASVIGRFDMVLTGDEQHARSLETQGLTRNIAPIFTERVVLVGPRSEFPAMSGLSAGDMMKKIFAENRLFISSLTNPWLKEAETGMWKGLGIAEPGRNRQYVESGRNDVDALMQAGDEGAFMLVGEASFAQYLDIERDDATLQKFAPMDKVRTTYLCLIAHAGFRRERAAAADRCAAWLLGPEGRALVDGFALGGVNPFRFVGK